MDYFKTIDTDVKIRFLELVLSEDVKLKESFLNFVKKMDIKIDDLEETIDEIVEDISNSIYEIDAQDYYCDMNDYHYWQDGDLGSDILDEIMKPYFYKIEQLFEKSKFEEGVAIFLALYEVSLDEELDADEEIFFGSVNDTLIGLIDDYEKKFLDIFEKIELNDESFFKIVDLIFLRMENDERYKIDFFNGIFEFLVTSKVRAEYLLKKLKSLDFDESEIYELLILIAHKCGDSELELSYLEKYFMQDKKLALKLLERYKDAKMDDKFYELSEKLLSLEEYEYSIEFGKMILENIDKERYKDTYIKALKKDVERDRSLDSYRKLKDYLPFDERMEFVESRVKNFDFYVKIMNDEKEYKKILDCIRDNYSFYDSFLKAVDCILDVYPKEAFEIATKKCDKLIENRGRRNYEIVVIILKFFKKNSSLEESISKYIDKIYRHKPALPALRDELKKSHLI